MIDICAAVVTRSVTTAAQIVVTLPETLAMRRCGVSEGDAPEGRSSLPQIIFQLPQIMQPRYIR